MKVLSELEPKRVFHYFEEICGIPHGSYNEKQISDYLVAFAKEHHLDYIQDSFNNVILFKDASAGYEEEAPIILQGHMDMVCEKDPDIDFDFLKDSLRIRIDGDDVTATGTTLGGDDGIAVAYALAILSDDTLCHPRLEVVITVSEETGMEGANGIDLSMLKGRRLLNLDSEEEGYMLVSCAGGTDLIAAVPAEMIPCDGICYEVSVDGLTGGHSGNEIDKGRANANVILARALFQAGIGIDLRLVSMEGGTKHNAIPRSAKAKIVVPEANGTLFEERLQMVTEQIAREYDVTDPKLSYHVSKETDSNQPNSGQVSETLQAMGSAESEKLLLLVNSIPNGVQTMSHHMEDLVETSLNLGVVKMEEGAISLEYSIRSSVASARKYLEEKIIALVEVMGGSAKTMFAYPAWEYRSESPFRDKAVRVFEQMYGRKPEIMAVHAGLECGILSSKIEGLDAISIGPDMQDIHTSKERLSISSTRRVYEYVLKLLESKDA